MMKQFAFSNRVYKQFAPFVAFCALLLAMLGCNNAAFLQNAQTPTAEPTRELLPTFTPLPSQVATLFIVITPPHDGTPGVIILPPNANPNAVIEQLPTNIPTSTPTPLPTPTPTQTAYVSPTPTFTPVDTPTATETFTPLPTDTPTPTQTGTPFIMAESGRVNLYNGPGIEWPLFAQLGPGIPVAVTGRNVDGTWLRLCCINAGAIVNGVPSDGSVWISVAGINFTQPISSLVVFDAGPPPPPTLTPIPTETPSATPTFTPTSYPFDLTKGPEFTISNQEELLTLYAKIYVGGYTPQIGCTDPPTPPPANKEVAAEGYFLRVTFEGFERPATNNIQPSKGGTYFDCSASIGAGDRREYNFKYEYRVPDPQSNPFKEQWYSQHPADVPLPAKCELIGIGTWSVVVTDGIGNQLSNPITFTTNCQNQNHEVYIAWVRAR